MGLSARGNERVEISSFLVRILVVMVISRLLVVSHVIEQLVISNVPVILRLRHTLLLRMLCS